MDWKKRGIHLKSLRPDDPGHRTLCEDLIRLPSQEDEPMSETLFGVPPAEEAAPEPAALSRSLLEELEEALGLLDQALEISRVPGD